MAERVSFDERYKYRLNERAAILGGEPAHLSVPDAIKCMHQALVEYETDVERRLAALEAARG